MLVESDLVIQRRVMDSSLLGQFFPFILHIDTHLFSLVAEYGIFLYVILFIIVFCETGLVITPFLPGDSLLFAAGTVVGAGYLYYPILVIVLLTAAIMGDAVNYMIGNYIGPNVFSRNIWLLNKDQLIKAHNFYEKHGGKAVIFARFIPIIRTVVPFVAGVAYMNPSRFLFYNIVGAAIWVIGLVSAGYFLGNMPLIKKNFSLVIYGIIIVSLLPIIIEWVRLGVRRKRI